MSIASIPRVAFVSHSFSLGGAERVLANTLAHLPKDSIEPIVILPKNEGPLVDLIRTTGVRLVAPFYYGMYIPNVASNDWIERQSTETNYFTNLFRELELDAVVVNTTVMCPAIVAAVRARLPVVLHSHGVVSPVLFHGLDTHAWAKSDILQLQLADTIVVPSPWVSDYYVQTRGISKERLHVVPNGTKIIPNAGSEPQSFPHKPRFVMLCTLEPNKGVQHFVKAAAKVLQRHPDGATFDVYGDGAPFVHEQLRELITKHKMQDQCVIRRKQLDVESIYRGCTATVVASHIESFSCVAVEAMSYAKPVIASRCGGPDGIVVDGETGFLVANGDVDAIADAMCKLIENPALASRMGIAGQQRVVDCFDIARVTQNYCDIIHKTIQSYRTSEQIHAKLDTIHISGWGQQTVKQQLTSVHTSASPVVPKLSKWQKIKREIKKGLRRMKGKSRPAAPPKQRIDLGELKSFTTGMFPRTSRGRIVMSTDLRSTPYREYSMRRLDRPISKIQLAIQPKDHPCNGCVGVEIVDCSQKIVAHAFLPICDLPSLQPATFVLPKAIDNLSDGWTLRVFTRDADAAVHVREIARSHLSAMRGRRYPLIRLQ